MDIFFFLGRPFPEEEPSVDFIAWASSRSNTSKSALQNILSPRMPKYSPVDKILLQRSQEKQLIWYTWSRARITSSLLEMPWLQPAHFLTEKRLEERKEGVS